ncbi:MAG: DNA replication/repair protein RecF [Succinivibrionaceae bacterium]|nr:DNA replication/repair protein RecF [Succinivibrionaceae bacterium]
MFITRLGVSDFRNLASLAWRPGRGLNLIHGPNGSGKTSLLEAVSYLALGRSFRNARVSVLIRSGAESFTLFCEVGEDGGGHPCRIGISHSRRDPAAIAINGERDQRLQDVADHLCVQIIHPQGSELLSGPPELRRGYIDWGVFFSCPEFRRLWHDYRRALAQRNSLLRAGAAPREFPVWDEALADLGNKINKLREEYLQGLNTVLAEKAALFLPGFRLSFDLHPGWDREADLRSLLASNLDRDRGLGYTLQGCHRADLRIKSNALAAGASLSRGQQKLLVSAMRLAQGELLLRQTGRRCVYLIDDLGSELDQDSRHTLLRELLANQSQVFITNISDDLDLPTDKVERLGLHGGARVGAEGSQEPK